MQQHAAIDDTRPVRAGEELDAERLRVYLAEQLPEIAGRLMVEQFPRGFSNLTYLLRLGEHELVLRRPPFGAKIKTAHDMLREYRVLAGLARVGARVPRPLLACEDETVLGAPFYVMERVRGVILRDKPPAGFDENTAQKLGQAFAENLAELHRLDYAEAGLAELGRPVGYVRRQIEGWGQRYLNAKTDDVPEVEQSFAWLLENLPPENAGTLIHNDYKYDNIVLAENDLTRIVAALDWEMATIGDPLMDLGTTLGYWVEAGDPEIWRQTPTGLTARPGSPTRRELAHSYAQASGADLSNLVFYYVYGLCKIAGIAQQIYHRFRQGHTRDPRFAGLIHWVRACGQLAQRAVELNRIDDL
jgi:aminoglycoside phosphotransferase (APT) family kinase protein